MVLGLHGGKGSGKDTVAAYLIKEHNFERRAFADPMKKSIAALFDIPFHEVDKMKDDPNATVGLRANWYDSSDRSPEPAMVPGLSKGMSFSEFIEAYATKAHREVFGDEFWLDYTMPMTGFYSGRNVVVTDMKYDEEAVRIRSCGGYRVTVENPLVKQDNTVSPELIDYYIVNSGKLDDFEHAIENMLVDLATADTRFKTALRDE